MAVYQYHKIEMAKMANKEDMAQLAFHYERICQIIVYFKSERDRDEDDEEQMSEIPSWFDSKFISSPKHLEENYDEKTKMHFLVSEQCTDGKNGKITNTYFRGRICNSKTCK